MASDNENENISIEGELEPPACPFCNSTDAELFSLFGQTLLGTQYYCNSCRSIYEHIRFGDED